MTEAADLERRQHNIGIKTTVPPDHPRELAELGSVFLVLSDATL